MAARIHPGVNDLNTTHPDLVTEWDQSNSKTPVEVVAGSTYQAMWNCPQGHQYIHQNHREHKFNYRLKRFAEDDSLIFRQGMTEHELALMNNLYRIYDAGKIRFVLRGVDDDMSYTENQQNRGSN